MIRHVWSIYCRDIIIDQKTNAVSVVNILETLHVSLTDDLPRATVPFDNVLATLWARREWDAPAKGRMRIKMIAPDGDVLTDEVKEVDLSQDHLQRLIARGKVFIVKMSGVYEWVILREASQGEWIEEARLPIYVEVKKNPPSTQTSAS